MRCKKHYTDLSSAVGVCACCLRERLLSLIAAQEQALAQPQLHLQHQNLDVKHRNSGNNPAFPRSVSPYIHNRKRNQSDGAAGWSDYNRRSDQHPHHPPRHRHSLSDQLSYTTPDARPTSTGHNTGVDSNKKRSFIRFFSLSYIFRSRNRKPVDSVTDLEQSDGGNGTWFASIVHGNRHRRKQAVTVDESTVSAAGGGVRRLACRDRGMSPVRNSDVGHEDVDDVTESYRNTPRRTPARRGGGGGHRREVSGTLTFCLSPLVRASPNRQWNQKGLAPDVVASGEMRAPVKAHLSNTKSFQANRSRKIADFGRPNQNR